MVVVTIAVMIVVVAMSVLVMLLAALFTTLLRAHHVLLVSDLVPGRFPALVFPLADIFGVVFS